MPIYHFPLKKREEVAEDTMSFHFDTSGTDFKFKAGQNCDFTLEDPPYTDAEGTTRPFSLSSSPNLKDEIVITTRMRETAFKKSLKEMPLGAPVKVEGPMGSFTLHKDAMKPAVMLAGGIGITPLKSIIEFATEENLPHRIILFYSNRTPEATAFLKEFEELKKRNPNFDFVATVTEGEFPEWPYAHGRIDEEMLKKHVPEISKAVFYSAGPPQMVSAMIALATKLGADPDLIKTEEFSGY